MSVDIIFPRHLWLPSFLGFTNQCRFQEANKALKYLKRITQIIHKHILMLVTQSYPTLCDPMDCSPPGSSVHGILQARILEWVAISFSRGSSQPRDRTQVSHIAGRCFNLWATRKDLALHLYLYLYISYWFYVFGEPWLIQTKKRNQQNKQNPRRNSPQRRSI